MAKNKNNNYKNGLTNKSSANTMGNVRENTKNVKSGNSKQIENRDKDDSFE